jgi:hypothetical protein
VIKTDMKIANTESFLKAFFHSKGPWSRAASKDRAAEAALGECGLCQWISRGVGYRKNGSGVFG